jgi:hypothetical protein
MARHDVSNDAAENRCSGLRQFFGVAVRGDERQKYRNEWCFRKLVVATECARHPFLARLNPCFALFDVSRFGNCFQNSRRRPRGIAWSRKAKIGKTEKRMRARVADVSGGENDVRVRMYCRDEIGNLAGEIKSPIGCLVKSVQKENRFASLERLIERVSRECPIACRKIGNGEVEDPLPQRPVSSRM